MRSVEMKAYQEGLPRFRVAIHDVNGAATEQIGQVAHLVNLHVVIPQVVAVIRAGVHVVVERATAESVKMVIATLQRTELRQYTEMPLANQSRALSDFLQQRRQG